MKDTSEDWESDELGNLVNFKTGKLNSNAAVVNGKYPFFTCSQETFRTNTFTFDTECVLLAGNNANGIYPLKYYHGRFDAYQRTYVITPKSSDRLSTRFLYYAMFPLLEHLKSISTGAATKFVTLTILNGLRLKFPATSTQRKIAGILSAYDDLIENNTRRIAILEQMAQAIYREWFVEFRFPGHENVNLVDSPLGKIPEGWEAAKMGEVLDIRYGKNLPTTQVLSEGEYPVYGAGGIIGYFDSYISHAKTALVTCRGNGSGTVWRTREAAFITNNSFFITPMATYSHWSYGFIELHLKHSNVAAAISGSAQPQITIDGLSQVMFVVPEKSVVSRFSPQVNEFNGMIDSLFRKNSILRKTRDLLLTKLISGELNVDDLDIDTGESQVEAEA